MKRKHVKAINDIAKEAHQVNVDNGWWDKDRNDAELFFLMISEIVEAGEELRKPAYSEYKVTRELSGCIVRIMDYCQGKGLDLGRALKDEIMANKERGFKHGGKRF